MKAKEKKYSYLYILQGNYNYGWEDLCAEEVNNVGLREIRARRKEYVENAPGSYRIISRRELNKNFIL